MEGRKDDKGGEAPIYGICRLSTRSSKLPPTIEMFQQLIVYRNLLEELIVSAHVVSSEDHLLELPTRDSGKRKLSRKEDIYLPRPG